ncbi:hypothetical protein GLOIN_2v1656727 [Rhizophagus irregularis DAOM 181602=DAOM 197198]|uniref:Uncharacterized protein n=1 Tax=Rhizophagus irregularis (strain DAOM 181602 / DAOM 197198 / MUCL 43194) TaxID=747089 RepID=A0A2P4PM81_RHIID|nr:hypothetical protein GLOIN_2v1656727 [Rhizophagus irregularis DAOM 181602=DAOM 197198]POG66481.1 hypothetical protein GLOIN_2v1656727 [Rhizophagus irregularis DAOM 181602=DAOM 197198]|eukprot:XP_025173347.1 hypothetical protein GLOIN_2v1656727 [Rhizophagus irregularis DAOM 181602=DAOM 197198]
MMIHGKRWWKILLYQNMLCLIILVLLHIWIFKIFLVLLQNFSLYIKKYLMFGK